MVPNRYQHNSEMDPESTTTSLLSAGSPFCYQQVSDLAISKFPTPKWVPELIQKRFQKDPEIVLKSTPIGSRNCPKSIPTIAPKIESQLSTASSLSASSPFCYQQVPHLAICKFPILLSASSSSCYQQVSNLAISKFFILLSASSPSCYQQVLHLAISKFPILLSTCYQDIFGTSTSLLAACYQ